MKKILFLLVTVFTLTSVYSQNNIEQNPQWDFFRNVIPRQQRITITGGNSPHTWTMTISDRYRVVFSCLYENNASNANVRYFWYGTGFVIWDDDRMKIQMLIEASGYWESKTSADPRASYRGSTVYDHTFTLQPEYIDGNFTGRLTLSSAQFEIPFYNDAGQPSRGNIISVYIGSSQRAVFTPKTASELNTSSRDSFGDWTWNQDRSKISLKSLTSGNQFVIWNRGGVISWSMEMGTNTRGISESTTETNDRILYFGLSFDGAPAENFSFIVNREATPPQNFIQLDYGVINRFLGTIDQKADAVLAQMRGKFILMLRYKNGNSNKTDMFLLEGLETILDNLN